MFTWRSTFVTNSKHEIKKAIYGVRAEGHAEFLLEELK
jgi:peroxiredoxin